jgi:hypothetical protein
MPSLAVRKITGSQPQALPHKPALLSSEDPKEYERLATALRDHAEPQNIIDEMYASDVVDNQWEIGRLRDLRAAFIKSSLHSGLRNILRAQNYEWPDALVETWAQGDPDSIKRVGDLLAGAGLTISAVEAQTHAEKMDTIERFDRLIAAAATRRNAGIMDLGRHRLDESQRSRPAIDVDYVDLASDE